MPQSANSSGALAATLDRPNIFAAPPVRAGRTADNRTDVASGLFADTAACEGQVIASGFEGVRRMDASGTAARRGRVRLTCVGGALVLGALITTTVLDSAPQIRSVPRAVRAPRPMGVAVHSGWPGAVHIPRAASSGASEHAVQRSGAQRPGTRPHAIRRANADRPQPSPGAKVPGPPAVALRRPAGLRTPPVASSPRSMLPARVPAGSPPEFL
jgi:hypothetical protein